MYSRRKYLNREVTLMKCPYCGADMTPGFIQSARPIFFTKEKHILCFLPSENELLLSAHNMAAPTCIAHHCESCCKIVIAYSMAEK